MKIIFGEIKVNVFKKICARATEQVTRLIHAEDARIIPGLAMANAAIGAISGTITSTGSLSSGLTLSGIGFLTGAILTTAAVAVKEFTQ
jgi:hypothetical protein